MNPSLDALMASANKAHAEGRLDDSAQSCRAVLERQPGNLPALILLGVVLAKKEEPAEALLAFQRAIQVEPRCAPAYQWLSMVHRRLGQKPEALRSAHDAVRLNPNDPLGLHHLGLCYLDTHEFASAEASIRKALALAPNIPIVPYSLGLALRGLNRNQEAIAAFRQSARMGPPSIPTLVALREVLMEENDKTGAAEYAKEIAKLQPNSAEANLWLARILMENGNGEEADRYVERGIDLKPDTALAHSLLGAAFQVKGSLDDADAQFRQSIELLPRQGSAYLAFATNRKMTESDRPMIERMEELVAERYLPPAEQTQLLYGLGKAEEDLGKYEAAMGRFDEGNKLAYQVKYGNRPYDRAAATAICDLTIRTFNADFLNRHSGAGSSSRLPIFVVGMIRSGTTLVEQILASHPLVGGAGEQSFWLEKGKAALPSGRLDSAVLGRLEKEYEDLLRRIAPGKPHVVDKMPMNYLMLGLIHLAFPKARIIHTQRHPADTCISIYTTPIRTRLGWAHDKGNIIFAYEQYQRLMAHWRQVLPAGTILDVRYEELVSDQEIVTRNMIGACGLEWEDACLRPDMNLRSVVTPSVWQVRQPIYRTSIERWRKYEPWLGPFAKLI